jgi:hypothetical protein
MKLPRSHVLDYLYSKDKSPLDFKWESLSCPPILSLLSIEDVNNLRQIATSIRYAGKIKVKLSMIDDIMKSRGFKRFHCGTNRAVYMFYEDQTFVIKVALDKVGLSDNPAEYKNQFLLKPFVTRCFEVSPCGTVATFERITPIINKDEFKSVAEDVFNLLTKCIIGKYVLNDIGTNSWMNYGVRPGFGVCLLDFPYVYELDGSKLYCTCSCINDLNPSAVCGGEIDYDVGFNNLMCSKCGKIYEPDKLEKDIESGYIYGHKEGGVKMKLSIKKSNGKIVTVSIGEDNKSSKVIDLNPIDDSETSNLNSIFDHDQNDNNLVVNKIKNNRDTVSINNEEKKEYQPPIIEPEPVEEPQETVIINAAEDNDSTVDDSYNGVIETTEQVFPNESNDTSNPLHMNTFDTTAIKMANNTDTEYVSVSHNDSGADIIDDTVYTNVTQEYKNQRSNKRNNDSYYDDDDDYMPKKKKYNRNKDKYRKF